MRVCTRPPLPPFGEPVLMVHDTFNPAPERLVAEHLRPYLPKLEYRELDRCGHYPWLERHASQAFFQLVREWLKRHMDENQLSWRI